jgi:hypothetical protein
VQTSVTADEEVTEPAATSHAPAAEHEAPPIEHAPAELAEVEASEASQPQPLSDDAAADLLSEPDLGPPPDFSHLLGEDELTGDPMVDNAAAFLAHEEQAFTEAGSSPELLRVAEDESEESIVTPEEAVTAPGDIAAEIAVTAPADVVNAPLDALSEPEEPPTVHDNDLAVIEDALPELEDVPEPQSVEASPQSVLTAPLDIAPTVHELDAPADEMAVEVVAPAESTPPIETSILAADLASPPLEQRALEVVAGAGEAITQPAEELQVSPSPLPVSPEPAPVAQSPSPAPATGLAPVRPAAPQEGLPRASVQDLLAGMTRDAGSYLGGLPLAIAPVVQPGIAPVTIKVKQDPPPMIPSPTPAPIGRVSTTLPSTQTVGVPPMEQRQAPPAKRDERPPVRQKAPPPPKPDDRAADKHLPAADLDELPELFDDGAALDALPDDLDAITDETDVLKTEPPAPPARAVQAPARSAPTPPARAAQAPPRAPAAPPIASPRQQAKFNSPPAKKVSSPFDGLDALDDELDDIITSVPEDPGTEGVPTNAFDGLAVEDEPGVDAFSLLPLPANDPMLGGGKVMSPSPAELRGGGLAPIDPLAGPRGPSRGPRAPAPQRPSQGPTSRTGQGGPQRPAQPGSQRPAQPPALQIQPLPERPAPQTPAQPPAKKRKKWKFFGSILLLLSLGASAGAWLQWPYLWQASGSLQFAGLEKLASARQRGFLAARAEELLSPDVLTRAAQLYRDHSPHADSQPLDARFVEPLVRGAQFDGNSLTLEHRGRDQQVERAKLWSLLTALYEANTYRITDADARAARLQQATDTLSANKIELQAIKDRQQMASDRAKAQQAVRMIEQKLASRQTQVDQTTHEIEAIQTQLKSADVAARPAAAPEADPQFKQLDQQIQQLEARLAVVPPPGNSASVLTVMKNVLAEYQQQIQLAQDGRDPTAPLSAYLASAMKAHDTFLHAVATFDQRQRMAALAASKEPTNQKLADAVLAEVRKSGQELTQQISDALAQVRQAAPAPQSLAQADRPVVEGISRKLLMIQAAGEQLPDSYGPQNKDIATLAQQWTKDHDALVVQREERSKQLAVEAAAAQVAAQMQGGDDQNRRARLMIAQRNLAKATDERDTAQTDLKLAQSKLAEFPTTLVDIAADNARLTKLAEQSQQLESEVARAASAEPKVIPVAPSSPDQAVALQQIDPAARAGAAGGVALLGLIFFGLLWRSGGSSSNDASPVVRAEAPDQLHQLPNHGAPVF